MAVHPNSVLWHPMSQKNPGVWYGMSALENPGATEKPGASSVYTM